jgi:chlorophyllase
MRVQSVFPQCVLLAALLAQACGPGPSSSGDAADAQDETELRTTDDTVRQAEVLRPPREVGEELWEPPPPFLQRDPYEDGPLPVQLHSFGEGETAAGLPFDLYRPPTERPPVVLFLHGFLADKVLYKSLLTQVASHGFAVVAPQNYAPGGLPFGKPSAAEEAGTVRGFLEWLLASHEGLPGGPLGVESLALVGHSRGGKVAWLLLVETPGLARAVAGVDPVDGTGGPGGNEPRVVQGPFDLPMPTLVIGTELGPVAGAGSFGQACAPEGDNHVQFFEASAAPAWHVLILEHGHMDMLDLGQCGFVCDVCPTGPDPAAARRLTGGLLASFLASALAGDEAALQAIDESAFPIAATLETRF